MLHDTITREICEFVRIQNISFLCAKIYTRKSVLHICAYLVNCFDPPVYSHFVLLQNDGLDGPPFLLKVVSQTILKH